MDRYDKEIYHKRLRSYPILDYARELGLTIKRKGTRYYTLKEHDSVIIDPAKNCFWRNSTGQTGSVIDFALAFSSGSLEEVMINLDVKTRNNTSPKAARDRSEPIKRELLLPKADKNMKNVMAYLSKTRHIDPRIISWLMHNKYIYQDINKNCVFVSYKEGVAVFACRRGTNTYKPFYGDVSGCDYSHLFFIENNSSSLYITESVIDTLSVMTMLSIEDVDYREYNYLSLTGVRKFEKAIHYHVKNGSYKRVILALDNDMAGRQAVEDIQMLLDDIGYEGEIKIEYPIYGKDMNDELIYRKENALWD